MSQIEHHQTGVTYWRSLEQAEQAPEVRSLIEQEFPSYDPSGMLNGKSSRRKLLKVMGASMALAGLTLTGCRRWPKEKLAPYTTSTENHVPGEREYYATALELGGVAQGLLVTSFGGRPIKVEGNPSHPMAWSVKGKQGSSDAFAQASLLNMYDPERSREVVDRTGAEPKESDWTKFTAIAGDIFGKVKGTGGRIAVLSEATSSPSAMDMKKRFLAAFPQAKWHEYEALSRDNELEGSRMAFGKSLRTRLNLEKAKVVISLDEDVLFSHPARTRYAADWAEMRRKGDKGEMNRVYIAESTFSVTGTVADVRLPVNPARLENIARAIALQVEVANVSGGEDLDKNNGEDRFVHSAVADLLKSKGASVVIVGQSASPVVHALAHAINAKIGAIGTTVTLIEDPAGDRPTHLAAITELTKAINEKKVDALLILGGNPVYDAPADLDFGKALASVPASIHLSHYNDETSRACKWHLPRAHYLEAWGDAKAWDGSVGLCQPLIEPLFGGKTPIEVLALVSGDAVAAGAVMAGAVMGGEQIVRRTWKEQYIKGGDFEKEYRKTMEAGVLENSASPAVTAANTATSYPATPAPAAGFFVRFTLDSHAYDGRFANNAWLQETHDPITKLVWDNAAILSKKDADTLGVKQGDIIRIDGNGRGLEIAAFVQPGQPVGVVTLPLGYGRTEAGSIGNKLGFNTYHLRTTAGMYSISGAKVSKTSNPNYTLATTMEHHILDDFAMKNALDKRIGAKGETGMIVRESTLEQYNKDPRAPHKKQHGGGHSLQLFNHPSKFNTPNAWGMTVDLNTCIGCNACVVACQAENNVPVVGKEQVLYHREMGWLRIDRYFKADTATYEKAGDDPNPQVVHQPMMCVHCENAPCEQVCPVAATMHDTEGLNTMIYNRCIGTRYCSNNCPYKVRRFNYFDWQSKAPTTGWPDPYVNFPDKQQLDQIDKIKAMVFNPDVSVRMRGVMEKCTYCTQRLAAAKITHRNEAFKEGKPQGGGELLTDGSVITACQQACPTQAITFGNLNDPNAQVVRLQKNPRAYDVLGELNTMPRTKFLAKLRNPAEGASAPARGHASSPAPSTMSPSPSSSNGSTVPTPSVG